MSATSAGAIGGASAIYPAGAVDQHLDHYRRYIGHDPKCPVCKHAAIRAARKIHKASDRDMRTRVIRRGPYTKQNRKQLGHHMAVGAGLGASAGAATGAHLGAAVHAAESKRIAEGTSRFVRIGSRGGAAAVIGGSLGVAGALMGASVGHDVARFQRHKAKHEMAKADHPRTAEATAAVIGGGAGQGVYQGAGYGTKHYVDARTRKGGRGVTPAQVNLQDKKLKANKSQYGMRLPKGDPGRNNAGYHRAYPKDLPHSGKIRLLGHTHEGKLGMAAGATATAIGAGSALAAAHHRLHKRDRPGENERHHLLAIVRAGQPKREPGHEVNEQWGGAARRPRGPDDEPAQIKLVRRNHYMFGQMTHIEHFDRDGKLTRTERIEPTKVSLARKEPKPKKKVSLRKKPAKVAKAEPLAIAGKLWRKPTLRSEFRRAFSGTRKGEDVVAHASQTQKVEHVRDPWGYPRQQRTGGHYGGDARKAMNTVIGNEAKNSPHSTAFKAGARTAKTAAVIGRHPEYGISIPAAGGGVGLAHHEIKRSKQKKGTAVAKSAFGVEKREAKQASPGQVMAVGAGTAAAGTGTAIGAHHVAHTRFRQLEGMSRDHPDYGKTLKGIGRALTTRDVASEVAGGGAALLAGGAILHHQKKKAMAAAPIAKYSAGTITYHQHAADLHGRKKASGRLQATAGLAAGAGGVALTQEPVNARVAMHAANIKHGKQAFHDDFPRWVKTAQAASRTTRKTGIGLAAAGAGLAVVGATRAVHHGRKQNKQSKLAQAARRDRNASLADTMAKSAFGVEKGAMSATLDAIKGFKGGLTGMVGAERTGAGAAGKIAGANTMGKLRPVGAALTKTPARLATTTGLAGLGTGMALGDGKKR